MCFIAQSKSEKIVRGERKSLDKKVNRIEEGFSKRVAKAVFARCAVEHMLNLYKRSGSEVLKQVLPWYQSVMISILP